ncbi:hypothetical protein WA026_018586 [Henosepilachna vigintioctopunctata]|uniref:Acid phosphatase n=1 Tax=Henosepilachna vigintioctopunctata TaxID=420089 RepID=A0AAW1U9U3_9CUCU
MYLYKISILYFYHLIVSNNAVSREIIQIQMVFRHGERSPTKLYPTDPYNNFSWPDGLGYLTNKGKLEMYNLGKQIRLKYESFIPKYYSPLDVEVKSSYSDRCLMSAQLFTSGLFTPVGDQIWNPDLLWQPIPIHYKPRNEDNMIASKQNCTKYDQVYKDLINSSKFKKILNDNRKLLDYLTNHTGMSIDTLREAEELYNTLEIEQSHNLSLPEWTKNIFPISMEPLAALSLASFTETDYMKKVKAGPLLKKILNNMKQKSSIGIVPKLLIYSGHDLTLVNILRALGFSEQIKPSFGAYIIFELLNGTSIDVNIIYNLHGEEKEFTLKECNFPCSLQNFEKVIQPLLPGNWIEECQL